MYPRDLSQVLQECLLSPSVNCLSPTSSLQSSNPSRSYLSSQRTSRKQTPSAAEMWKRSRSQPAAGRWGERSGDRKVLSLHPPDSACLNSSLQAQLSPPTLGLPAHWKEFSAFLIALPKEASISPPGLCWLCPPDHNTLFLHLPPIPTLKSELKTFIVFSYLTHLTHTHTRPRHYKLCCFILRVYLVFLNLNTFRESAVLPNSPRTSALASLPWQPQDLGRHWEVPLLQTGLSWECASPKPIHLDLLSSYHWSPT